MRRFRLSDDFLAGLLFMAFGVAALVIGRHYAMGDATRMGPGYFPRALGLLLLALGALLSLRALRADASTFATWRWRPIATILSSLVVFCVALTWLGLVVSGLMLIVVASTAAPDFRWKEALASAAIQVAIATALFVYGLKIPLPVWPWFVGG
jgi:hypothetical protein